MQQWSQWPLSLQFGARRAGKHSTSLFHQDEENSGNEWQMMHDSYLVKRIMDLLVQGGNSALPSALQSRLQQLQHPEYPQLVPLRTKNIRHEVS